MHIDQVPSYLTAGKVQHRVEAAIKKFPHPPTMEGLFFNVNNGYIEGIVRGYRNGLLTGQNYNNLTQCETIDGEACSLYLLG